jgi:tripartite-type tricarboxylate transporter receptor subunit TctC
MNTNPMRRALLCSAAGALLGALAARDALAQTSAQLRVVVGFPAGGTADALARALAPALSSPDSSVIVENRTGATGQLAADFVRGSADGSAVLLTPSSVLSLVPQLYRKPMYDGVADFAPIGCICDHSFGFAVPATSPHQSLADYLRWAKVNAGDATYATPGPGSAPHFLGVMLAREADVPLVHVPYRGVMPGVQDLIGGQVSATFNPLTTLIEFHKAGRIRVLATTNPQRVASLPQVPTVAELKLHALELVEWYGLFASSRVPPATVAALQKRLSQALAQPALADAARRLEVTLRPLDGPAQQRLLRADVQRWTGIVRSTGIQLEA